MIKETGADGLSFEINTQAMANYAAIATECGGKVEGVKKVVLKRVQSASQGSSMYEFLEVGALADSQPS